MIDVARIPLSLYIHFPWCVRKCPYCDFNSHESNAPPWREYLDALIIDLERQLSYVQDREITTIFIGGGTPSLVPGRFISELLAAINSRVSLSQQVEITIEANPGSADEENFSKFLEAGVNRLSIGIQSFRNEKLQALGRVHDADQAQHAIAHARQVGFTNINLDIMHNLPNDSAEDWRIDLESAISFNPQHISWYELTIEPGTVFSQKPPPRPQFEDIIESSESGFVLLERHGFAKYEVSAYAAPEFECRHNKNYWEFGDYLGIGAGAHGKVTKPDGVYRTERRRSPQGYISAMSAGVVELEKIIPNEELPFEFMLGALRLTRGLPIAMFQQRTGLPLADIEDKLERAHQQQWLDSYDEIIRTTAFGARFLNSVQSLFLAAS